VVSHLRLKEVAREAAGLEARILDLGVVGVVVEVACAPDRLQVFFQVLLTADHAHFEHLRNPWVLALATGVLDAGRTLDTLRFQNLLSALLGCGCFFDRLVSVFVHCSLEEAALGLRESLKAALVVFEVGHPEFQLFLGGERSLGVRQEVGVAALGAEAATASVVVSMTERAKLSAGVGHVVTLSKLLRHRRLLDMSIRLGLDQLWSGPEGVRVGLLVGYISVRLPNVRRQET